MLFDKPKARTDELLSRPMGGELIVYDLRSHRAAALNETAAAVWRACDGLSDAEEIGRKLSAGGKTVDQASVWQALKLLDRESLLEERIEVPPFMRPDRRAFVSTAA